MLCVCVVDVMDVVFFVCIVMRGAVGARCMGSVSVSLASASLITSCSWQTLSTLSSDHLPILIRLQMKTPSNPGLRRTYVNLKNANWDRYRQEVEAALSKRSLPTDCQRDEKIFRTILFKAASHHIPYWTPQTP